MRYVLYILYAAVAAAAVILLIIAGRTVMFSLKKRKLGDKKLFREEKNIFYAERLSQMIQCATVSVRGSYDDTEFRKHRDVLKNLFPLIHEKGEMITVGEDCYIYKIKGKNTNKNIMLMSHHDVVAASGDWKYPPFSGIMAEGKLWGRGTVDTKTTLFAEFTAVEEILEKGDKPNTNVWIVSSHNEELLGDGIYLAVDYFKKNNIIFDAVIDEGGAVVELQLGKKAYKLAMLATHEKGRYALELNADKKPLNKKFKGASAITRMSAFITDVQNGNNLFKKKISPKLQGMLQTIGSYLPIPIKTVTSNLWCFSRILMKLAPKVEKQAADFLGTTLRFDGINGGKYDGKITKECKALVTFRIMDDTDFEKDIAKFKKKADEYGISYTEKPEICEYRAPADTDCEEFRLITDIIRNVFPDAVMSEYINPAFTDARAVMDICRKTYRFIPVVLDEQQFNSIHGPNENISIDAIGNAVEFFAQFLDKYM